MIRTSLQKTAIDPPLSVQLHLTNRCNANCLFCWLHYQKQGSEELPDKKWLEIADEICRLGVPRVTISGGGEPLLRARLVLRLMRMFSQAGVEGTLLTNGTLITEEVAENIVSVGWESIHFSIHAPNARLHDRLMDRKGAFSLARKGMRNLVRAKRKKGSSSPELCVRVVITRDNMLSLQGFIRLAKSSGVTKVIARMVNDLETATKGIFALSEKDRRAFMNSLAQARELAEQAGVGLELEFDTSSPPGRESGGNRRSRVGAKDMQSEKTRGEAESKKEAPITGCSRIEGEPHCSLPFRDLVIFANGTASPCCNFFEMQFEEPGKRLRWLEDVKHASPSAAWRGGFITLRKNILSNHSLPHECEICSADMRVRRNQPAESAWHLRFRYFRRHKKYAEGVRFGRDQLKANSANPYLHAAMGEFYMGGREYGKALSSFKNALKHSRSEEARERNMRLMALCRHMEALSKKRGGRERSADGTGGGGGDPPAERIPSPLDVKFRRLREKEEYRAGLRFGKRQLKRYHDCAALHHHIGEFHMELGEYGKAIEHLSIAVRLNPSIEWSRFSLGKCYFLTGQFAKAEKMLRENLACTSERLSHYHSLLFLAMAADARHDKKACRKAFEALQRFNDCIGKEIPLEREFLERVENVPFKRTYVRTGKRMERQRNTS